MSTAGAGQVRIPPPRPVVVSALLMCAEAAGVLVLAVVILLSGLRNSAAVGQLLAQVFFFLVLALAMGFCGVALLGGRRWARTPTIVVQLVLAAVGYWLAVPSGQPGLGVVLFVLAAGTGALLVGRAANRWIRAFPALFGPAPDR